MSHRTTIQHRQQILVHEMTQQMTTLVQQLVVQLGAEPAILASLEQQVVRLAKTWSPVCLARSCHYCCRSMMMLTLPVRVMLALATSVTF